MIKHGLIVPMMILFGALIFGFYGHEVMSREQGVQSNVIHDFIGAKILTKNEIEFQKILVTQGKDVIFCDAGTNLLKYSSNEDATTVLQKISAKCGKVLTENGVKVDNGSGRFFGKIFTKLNEDNQEPDEKTNLSSTENADTGN